MLSLDRKCILRNCFGFYIVYVTPLQVVVFRLVHLRVVLYFF